MNPRVIWCAQKPTKYITNDIGIITGLYFRTKKQASEYGKPVKFIECIGEKK